ncbi:MAG TPA: hypothetical protein VGM59_11660 [Dongiaceae bacterium]
MTIRAADLTGLKVLVIEDNFLVADVLCESLREYGCEIVGPAPDIDRSEKLIDQNISDGETLSGALLDINLGGFFSFPIAAKLQALGIPFIFLTGYDEKSVVPVEFQSIRRVSKPCDVDELAAIIRAAFR